MTLNEVLSSNIKKAGWENNTLLVEYTSGAQYEYQNVPKEVYEGLMTAESKGKYMNSIKGAYSYKRV